MSLQGQIIEFYGPVLDSFKESFWPRVLKEYVMEGNHYRGFPVPLHSLSRSLLMVALRCTDMRHIPNTASSFKFFLTETILLRPFLHEH